MLNVAEVVILLILVALVVDGGRVGLVKTFFSTIRMIISAIVAYFMCFFMNGSVPPIIQNGIPVLFLIIIGIFMMVLGAIERLLNIVDKIPIAKTANRIAGVPAGLLKGIILVWILFYTILYFRDTDWGMRLWQMISESDMLSLLNAFNPLIYGFDGMIINNSVVYT